MASARDLPEGWGQSTVSTMSGEDREEMQRFSQETGDPRIRAAMTAVLRAEESGNPMDVSTAAAPILLDELRENSPFWSHKGAAQAAFRLQDWRRALESYTACKDQLQASPIQMQRPTDGGAAQKALGAELAKLNANISMLHLKLHQPELAVAAAAAAVSNFASWPKAHARHAEALSAAGRHEAAAQAFHMAAFRAEQQGGSAAATSWSAQAEAETQRAEQARAAAEQRAMQSAAAGFDDFFARALRLSVLSEAEHDALTDAVAAGAASEGELVQRWTPTVRLKEAQLNAGLFEALDGHVTEEVLRLLSATDLARMEQTCRFFSGALDGAARERLRRFTRCKRLRAASLSEASGSLRAMEAPVAKYCVERLDAADEAMQTLVATCAPVLLDACKGKDGFSPSLFDVCVGLPLARKEVFWHAFLGARAAWLSALPAPERSRPLRWGGSLEDAYALDCDGYALWASLRVARTCQGVVSVGAVLTLLHTLSGSSDMNDVDELEAEGRYAAEDGTPEPSTDEWVSAYNSMRDLAGADLEVLLTLHKLKTARGWYRPADPELLQMCCQILQNKFRSSQKALGTSPLREPMGRHLMAFLGIFNTGPNRFPDMADLAGMREALRRAPRLTAAWQGMLASATGWLEESERWGYALHLRAHQILHSMAADQPLEVDYWTFQALLVTQNLMRGPRALSRQIETLDGLAAFFADLFEMVSAYQVGLPAISAWYQRVMAQHRRMTQPRQVFGNEIWNNTMDLQGPGSGFLD